MSGGGPSNDFIVSLGDWGPDGRGSARARMEQKGTLMHEFGHNLGLGHGGNYGVKQPNYLSIMNYAFQLEGIPSARSLDYSRISLASLDESNLDERVGIQDGAYNTYYYLSSPMTADASVGQGIVYVVDGSRFSVGDRVLIESNNARENSIIASISENQLTMQSNPRSTYRVGGDSKVRIRITGIGLVPIDWNRNGRIDRGVGISINEGPCFGEKGRDELMVLSGFDDWAHVKDNLNFRVSETIYDRFKPVLIV